MNLGRYILTVKHACCYIVVTILSTTGKNSFRRRSLYIAAAVTMSVMTVVRLRACIAVQVTYWEQYSSWVETMRLPSLECVDPSQLTCIGVSHPQVTESTSSPTPSATYFWSGLSQGPRAESARETKQMHHFECSILGLNTEDRPFIS